MEAAAPETMEERKDIRKSRRNRQGERSRTTGPFQIKCGNPFNKTAMKESIDFKLGKFIRANSHVRTLRHAQNRESTITIKMT